MFNPSKNANPKLNFHDGSESARLPKGVDDNYYNPGHYQHTERADRSTKSSLGFVSKNQLAIHTN